MNKVYCSTYFSLIQFLLAIFDNFQQIGLPLLLSDISLIYIFYVIKITIIF